LLVKETVTARGVFDEQEERRATHVIRDPDGKSPAQSSSISKTLGPFEQRREGPW
jgi:hypothetical protein